MRKKTVKLALDRLKLPTPLILLFILLYAAINYYLNLEQRVELPKQHVPICLYSNQAGDDLRQTFTQAILQAKESITCLIYSLTDEEIIAALRNRAEAGVQVLVIADPVATQDAASKLGPKVQLVSRRQKGLMHNKLLAIDHKQAWLGSANFTRDSLLLHANIVMGIDSRALALAIEEKAKNLTEKPSRKCVPLSISTPEQTLELSFLPDDSEAIDKVIRQIAASKKSVKVAMFTFTHPDLVESLVDAHKRGVAVQVVLDSDSSRKTSSKAYQRLLKEKVNVLVSQRIGLLHEKMAIIDDSQLIMGSANWTRAAFTQNSENLCFLRNLTAEQRAKLDRFWATTLREAK